MSLDRIIAELEQRIGVNPEALGATVMPAVIQARMRALGLGDVADYAARVAAQPGEFQALAEEIVVTETWFFRGGGLFAYLVGEVVKRQTTRILSVPCGSGEEPYSLAIALYEAGMPPRSWRLDAVDLSARNLDDARRGRYGAFSFRQTRPELRERYFRPSDGAWELLPPLRESVRFQQGNLIDPHFLAGELPYDVILCRNLFIYLTPAARRQALATLERLLAPEGLLCVGHAEPLHLADDGFERVGPVEYFVYRRTSSVVRGPWSVVSGPAPPVTRSVSEGPSLVLRASTSIEPPPADLARARQQADSGALDDALATCRAHVERFGPSAEAYSLMGVVHQSRQESAEATRCFQKALYLQPDHHDALLHLMLLCEQQGDRAQAALLRRRLERAAAGGEA